MGMSFRMKVLLAISAITLLASIAISISFYNRSAQTVSRNYSYSLRNTLSVFVQAFDDTMRTAYDISVQLACSDELKRKIQQYQTRGGSVDDALEITNYLRQYQRDSGAIDSIYLYLREKKQVITSTEYHAVQEIFYTQNYPWLKRLEADPEGTRLTPAVLNDKISRAPRYVLTFYRTIQDVNGKEIGAVAVNVNERYLFYQLLNTSEQEGNISYFLVDEEGVIGSAASTSQIGRTFEAGAKLKDQLIVSESSPMTGFQIVCVSNRGEILKSLKEQQFFIIAALIITAILVLLLASRISTLLYRPVKELRKAMERVSGGDLTARAPVLAKDEIGFLSEGFNETVSHVEDLIGELVNERMHKKEAELEALQYQITPHFMYNTLNSIKYAAILQKSDRIAEQLGAFIELLQASINRKGAFLTVEEELRMVRNYVMLQQFRYMDSFMVEYNVDPSTLQCYVPRLILQPLVENAILHGIDHETGNCRIQISVKAVKDDEPAGQNDSWLELAVEDNGGGMTTDQIVELMTLKSRKRSGHFSGIGISNIRDRLQLYYGQKGMLQYSSSVGAGTCAIITLPVSADPAEFEI